MKILIMFVSIIILLIMASFIMGDNLTHLIYFYLNPKKNLEISPQYYSKALEKYNSDKEKFKDTDNITVNYYRVRNRIIRTFFVVLFIVGYSLLLVWTIKKFNIITIQLASIQIMQIAAIFLILWALLGQNGWDIQTIK